MSKGAGRGRGWLNLDKNLPNPGGGPPTTNTIAPSNTTLDDGHAKLVKLIEEFTPRDDGIALNRKLSNLIKLWETVASNGAEVEGTFKNVYLACKKDANLVKGLIVLVSANSFHNLIIHDVIFRKVFMNLIQDDYDNRIQLQAMSPNEFRNSVCLLIGFYGKNHFKPTILAKPTVDYLEMLLDSEMPADIELFALQFYAIGSILRQHCEEKLKELLVRIRQTLINSNNLTKTSRAWLLLSLESDSGSLTTETCRFYEDLLGSPAMAEYQGTLAHLSIVSSQPTEKAASHNNFVAPSRPTHSLAKEDGNHENAEATANGQEKIGRPILGVGARLQKNAWREDKPKGEDNRKGWRSENKSNKGFEKRNKGWEHDDRFDINYD